VGEGGGGECCWAPAAYKRPKERARKENMYGWLTVASKQCGFDLSREMFRDRLNLRHGQELRGLPSVCDGCGAPFSLEHALNYMKGGVIKLGHDFLESSQRRVWRKRAY